MARSSRQADHIVGEALSTRLRREGRLSLRATSVISSQIARALRVAHEAGVVHRDLEPGNIFLAQVDDEEVVKVLDFGIAKDVRARTLDDISRGRAAALVVALLACAVAATILWLRRPATGEEGAPATAVVASALPSTLAAAPIRARHAREADPHAAGRRARRRRARPARDR